MCVIEQPVPTEIENEIPNPLSFDPRPMVDQVEQTMNSIGRSLLAPEPPRPTLSQVALGTEALVSGVQDLIEQYLALTEPFDSLNSFHVNQLSKVPKEVAEHAFEILKDAVGSRSHEVLFPRSQH